MPLIALFGIPLGFGGLGVLVGILGALGGILVAFYAVAGSILLTGALFMLMGLTRVLAPHMFDKLVAAGFIQFDGQVAQFLDQFSASEQGLFMILFACLLGAGGFGMLRLGKHLLRGLRFLSSLLFDKTRRLAQRLRRKLHPENREGQGSHAPQQADGRSAAV
jgi:hypothetical protein